MEEYQKTGAPRKGADRRHPSAATVVTLLLFTYLAGAFLSPLTVGIGVPPLLWQCVYAGLPILLFFPLYGKRPPLLAAPTRGGWRRVAPLFPLFVLSMAAVAALTSLLLSALELPITGGAPSYTSFAYDLLTSCLLPAAFEEGLFRLAVLSLLLRERRAPVALFVTAILFSFLHCSLYQFPYALVGGLFLGLVALLGGSVVYAAVFHFAANLFTVTLSYLPLWLPSDLSFDGAGYLTLAVYAALFVWAVLAVLSLYRSRQSLAPYLSRLDRTAGEALRAFLSPLALFAAVCTLLAVI